MSHSLQLEKLKSYISAVILLVAGALAVVTTLLLIPSTQLYLNTATTTSSPQGQSAFITSTAGSGEAAFTEILVNTSIQFPIKDVASEQPTSSLLLLAPLAFFLFIAAIVIGMRSTRTQLSF